MLQKIYQHLLRSDINFRGDLCVKEKGMDMKYLYLLLVLLVRNVTEGDAQIFVKDTVGVRMDSTAIIGECIDFPCWIQFVSADSTGTFLLV